MTQHVIETRALTKRYGEAIVAVDALDLRVRRGEVYGFLGPNGAGKTTTLRMLLGLVRPTSGDAAVLGAAPGSPAALGRIGAMVEAPGLYPYLSGRDNLRVLAGHAGAPPERVDAVLAEVGLAGRAGDRARTYSMGMKQRLGVAAALLKDPELLILDEPTNGLDPAGMAEMRSFIRSLARGRAHGRALEPPDGRGRAGLRPRRGDPRRRARRRGHGRAVARPRHAARARRTARRGGAAGRRAPRGRRGRHEGAVLELSADVAAAAAINRALVTAGIEVSEISERRASLEDVFLELTTNGGGPR